MEESDKKTVFWDGQVFFVEIQSRSLAGAVKKIVDCRNKLRIDLRTRCCYSVYMKCKRLS